LFRDFQNIINFDAKMDTLFNKYHPLTKRIGLKTGDMTYKNCVMPHGFFMKDVSQSIKGYNYQYLNKLVW